MVKVVVVGGSAGSHEPLLRLVSGLPAELPAAVLVTLHVPEWGHSRLPKILGRAGRLPAAHAADGEPLTPGRILVAPPGRHLLVDDGRARLSSGPRINRARPAVDALFASAATAAGPGVVAVVLSGALDDGAVGAALVAAAGGTVVVQDPATAQFGSMPAAARSAAPTATVAAGRDLAATLVDLVDRTAPAAGRVAEGSIAMTMSNSADPRYLTGDETGLTRMACPECGGGLAEVQLPTITYYRCHVGHQYGPRTLAAAQAEAVEQKLWQAMAALEEQAAFLRRLAEDPAPAAATDGQAAADPGRGALTAEADRVTGLAESLRGYLEDDGDGPRPLTDDKGSAQIPADHED